jgi:hypothetical protein
MTTGYSFIVSQELKFNQTIVLERAGLKVEVNLSANLSANSKTKSFFSLSVGG